MKRQGYITVTAQFSREGQWWVASCVELGTSAYGETIEEAKDRLEEAVELHLDTLEAVGECERFLRENGVALHSGNPPAENTLQVHAPLANGVFVRPLVHRVDCTAIAN